MVSGIALRSAAVVLCVVSTIYTMLLCINFAETVYLQGLMALTGFALELMKFAIFPTAQALWQRARQVTAILCAALGIALVTVSFIASVTFFSEVENVRQAEQLSQNADYQLWHDQLASLSDRITLLHSSASKDLENGYRARANATLATLDEVERQRARLMSERPQQVTDAQSPIDSRWIFRILALLIELCAITGLVVPRLLAQKRKRRHNLIKKKHTRTKPADGRAAGSKKQHRHEQSSPVDIKHLPEDGESKNLYKTLGAQKGSSASQLAFNM